MHRQIVNAGSVCLNLFPVLTVFLAHTQPARQFFIIGSGCVGNFLAHAQHAQKHKMVNIVFEKKISPVLKSPTHIGFIYVKKVGQKSHTLAILRSLQKILSIPPLQPNFLSKTAENSLI
jgi:hypothetical protein